jgi:AraC-like DNA-binding protein
MSQVLRRPRCGDGADGVIDTPCTPAGLQRTAWRRPGDRPEAREFVLPYQATSGETDRMPTLFRAGDHPVGRRLERWREILSEQLIPMDVRLDGDPEVTDQLLVGHIGPLRVVDSTTGDGEVARTAKHIRRFDPGSYQVFLQLQGKAEGEQEGRSAWYSPGDLSLVDLSRPLRCRHFSGRTILVTFPQSMLPLRAQVVTQLLGTRISGSAGTGALVAGMLRQLPRHLDTASGTGVRLGSAVVDLVHAALAEHLEQQNALPSHTRRRALLLRIHAFIEQRLGEPDLTPARIAAAHHISVRYLHKLFEHEGCGVAEMVRQRRLEHCRRDLQDPSLADRPVSSIARHWGFTDPAYFSRVFRRAYGSPPAEFRRASAQSQ